MLYIRGARKERQEEGAKRGHVLLLACSVGARVARSVVYIPCRFGN